MRTQLTLLTLVIPDSLKGASRFHPRGVSDEPTPLSPITTSSRLLRAQTHASVYMPGMHSLPASPPGVPTPRQCQYFPFFPPVLSFNPDRSSGTQEDQDQTDAYSRKKAMKELVQSWMDRLQLISVIVSHPTDFPT